MKKNQKKGWMMLVALVVLSTSSLALYAWQKKDLQKVEWIKHEPGKPDSILTSTFKGNLLSLEDTMKFVKLPEGKNVIVHVSDTLSSEIVLIKK